jgi:hypothetical protein
MIAMMIKKEEETKAATIIIIIAVSKPPPWKMVSIPDWPNCFNSDNAKLLGRPRTSNLPGVMRIT